MRSGAEIVRTSMRQKTKEMCYYENGIGKSLICLKLAPKPSSKNEEMDQLKFHIKSLCLFYINDPPGLVKDENKFL